MIETRFLDENGKIIAPNIDYVKDIPNVIKLPDSKALGDLSNGDLLYIIQRYGGMPSWAELKKEANAYVNALKYIPPGSPKWKQTTESLIESNSRRMLLGTARRLSERYSTKELLKDKPYKRLIRIGEDDENSCDTCQELSGAIGTYEEHTAIGLPGSASCDGGNYCRCVLCEID